METFDYKAYLLFALEHYGISLVSQQGDMLELAGGYSIEIEGEKLYKLLHEGQVVAPFSSVEEMCRFLLMDMQAYEED
ncbi:MAG: hypothetical protein D6730_00285 [Bacteroidetes bacterium]|nr:MAG: hypothetical protein D6730_00285 [Bacteroidota bacterium]